MAEPGFKRKQAEFVLSLPPLYSSAEMGPLFRYKCSLPSPTPNTGPESFRSLLQEAGVWLGKQPSPSGYPPPRSACRVSGHTYSQGKSLSRHVWQFQMLVQLS